MVTVRRWKNMVFLQTLAAIEAFRLNKEGGRAAAHQLIIGQRASLTRGHV